MASLVLRKEPRSFRSQGERLVFVGGAPRSGTTLLQHILDSHPNVFGGPEYDCIPTIIITWRQVVDAHVRGRLTAFNSREQIDAAFTALIENLLLPAAEARNAEPLSEKTPFNVMVFTDLLELLPRCRAIHIVRDPRAVIASLLNVGRRAQANNEPILPWATNFYAAIPFVIDALNAGFQAQHRFGERLLTFTYEALVSCRKSPFAGSAPF
jgi:protein-tyrosine sulfotransferase